MKERQQRKKSDKPCWKRPEGRMGALACLICVPRLFAVQGRTPALKQRAPPGRGQRRLSTLRTPHWRFQVPASAPRLPYSPEEKSPYRNRQSPFTALFFVFSPDVTALPGCAAPNFWNVQKDSPAQFRHGFGQGWFSYLLNLTSASNLDGCPGRSRCPLGNRLEMAQASA